MRAATWCGNERAPLPQVRGGLPGDRTFLPPRWQHAGRGSVESSLAIRRRGVAEWRDRRAHAPPPPPPPRPPAPPCPPPPPARSRHPPARAQETRRRGGGGGVPRRPRGGRQGGAPPR